MKIKHPYLRFIEGEGTGEGGQPSEGAGAEGGSQQQGTGATYTAPESQADLDRIVEARLARERAKFAGYDDYKAKAEQFDVLSAASRTDQERAVEEARKEERERVAAEATPRIVRAEFRAAAKGVLTDEALAALVEDLDLTKYVTDSGDVDEEKVAKKISALAPANGGSNTHQLRDLGQGQRKATKSTGVSAGAELFAAARTKQ